MIKIFFIKKEKMPALSDYNELSVKTRSRKADDRNIPQASWAWSEQSEVSSPREKKIFSLEKNYSGSEHQLYGCIMMRYNGQILIETMVALGMVVIGVLGLLSLLSSSIGINKVVSDQYVAAYLASEGIEIVKNIIDNNIVENRAFNDGLLNCQPPFGCRAQYDDFKLNQDSPSEFIKFEASTGEHQNAYQYTSGEDTPFIRVITVSQGEIEDELVVHSIVNWKTRGGLESSIDLEDHFYNWRR